MLEQELCVSGSHCNEDRSASGLRFSKRPHLEKPRRLNPKHAAARKPSRLNRHLVMMVKVPTAGQVKTRLANDIGLARATTFYRFATNSVLSRLAASRRWHTYLAISPDNAINSRAWPLRSNSGDILRLPQGQGNLGRRMQRVLDGMPAGPIVIVGSDIPAINQRHIASAFKKLGRSDAVYGPSPDGGYWLFGMRRVPRIHQAFLDVRWSTPQTLQDTLKNLQGLSVTSMEELSDIDEASDLVQQGALATRRVLPKNQTVKL